MGRALFCCPEKGKSAVCALLLEPGQLPLAAQIPQEQHRRREQHGPQCPAQPQPGKERRGEYQRRQSGAGAQQPGFQDGPEQFGRAEEQPEPHPQGSTAPAELPEPQGSRIMPLPMSGSRSSRVMAKAAANGCSTPSSHSPADSTASNTSERIAQARSIRSSTRLPK